VEGVRCQLGFKGGFNAPRSSGGGGLALLWDDSIQVVIKSFLSSHIDAVVEDRGGGGIVGVSRGSMGNQKAVDEWTLGIC
jgi:hypothetical protein